MSKSFKLTKLTGSKQEVVGAGAFLLVIGLALLFFGFAGMYIAEGAIILGIIVIIGGMFASYDNESN